MGDKILKRLNFRNNNGRNRYRNRIITSNSAQELIKEGYFAIDAHCHSSFSYDVPDVAETSPENVIAAQINSGLQPIITDHDTLNGFNFLKSKGMKTVPAVELTIKPAKADLVEFDKPIHTLHINIFGLNNRDLGVLSKIAAGGDLDALVGYMRSRNLDWMYNHPFWHESGEKLNWKVIPGLAKNYFDVIEVNAGQTRMINDLTIRLAEKQGKAILASTDNHTGRPGWSFTVAEGKNFREFWDNIKKRRMFIVRGDMTALKVVKETANIINQVFRSNIHPEKHRRFTPDLSIGILNKFARLVTSGKLKDQQVMKKIMSMIFHTLNYTAGPAIAWKYYVNKKNSQIQAIHKNIDNIIRQLDSKQKNADKPSRHSAYTHTA